MKRFLATIAVVAVIFSCKLSANAAELEDIFSAQYYADSYEDLYEAFEYDEAKLLEHVKEYGLEEKRDISPILDVVYYRESNPDLEAAFGDDWDAYVNHWFEYGIKEGRDNGTNFDIIRYVNSYADLREAFDEDYEALAKHYIEYGMKENRVMALKPQIASAPATVTPTVFEVHTYDEEGRVEVTEVYSDSSKTTLLYTIEYEYRDDEGHTYAYYTDAQGNLIRADIYNENGVLEERIVVTDIYEDGTASGIDYIYKEGKLYVERIMENSKVVKETYYYENGRVGYIREYDQTTENCVKEMAYYGSGALAYYAEYDPETEEVIVEKYYDEDGNEGGNEM